MAFDVKEMVNKVVDKAKNDPKFMENLKNDPEKAIESVIGIDIPDGAADKVVAGVKAQLSVGKITDILGKLGK